jgi:hypothetical protein
MVRGIGWPNGRPALSVDDAGCLAALRSNVLLVSSSGYVVVVMLSTIYIELVGMFTAPNKGELKNVMELSKSSIEVN